jgi:hypothetical protein
MPINHNVTIVSVFDLEYVTRHGVGGHRLDKVETGLLERYSIFTTIFCNEKPEEVIHFCAAKLVTGCCIGHYIDDTTLSRHVSRYTQTRGAGNTNAGSRRRDSVRKEIQRQTNAREYVLKHGNNLQSQHILPTVISYFENSLLPSVIFGHLLLSWPVDIKSRVGQSIDYYSLLAHFEGGHERCLGYI